MEASDYINDYQQQINKFTVILNDLEGNTGFDMLMEALKDECAAFDQTWHLITKPDELQNARVVKLAYNLVTDLLVRVKLEKQKCEQAIQELEKPQGDVYGQES